MVLFVLVYLGGVLTIISPCILPVLPFVFARANRPFVRSGLPLLIGMAATFAAVQANQYGRGVSIALLALSRSRASHWRTCFRLAEAVARGRRVDQEGRVPFLDPGVQAYAFTFG